MLSWHSILLANTFMPVQGTDIAREIDTHYGFLVIASLISFVILIGGMTLFIIKYKRKSENDETAYITHNHFLEFLWSFIPFLIVMGIFFWGAAIYDKFRTFPEKAEEIHVIAQKWAWEFKYKNGVTLESAKNEALHVPLGKPVRLIISSRDVLHSFFIPGFRNKQDAVPGRYTSLWFEANKEGEYQVFCTEYCGTGHSNMPARIRVVAPEAYTAWLEEKKANTPVDPNAGNEMAMKGAGLIKELGCTGCHSMAADAPKLSGPNWFGLYGNKREFAGGSSAVADESYIRESIINPAAKIVKGYEGVAMTPYAGRVSDEDLENIIEFIKTLK